MAKLYNIKGLTYNTKENPEWFTRALFGGRLLQGGYITVMTGIKGGEIIGSIDLQAKILQLDGRDCAWTPNQVLKLSDKKAKVETYKINLEQCINELENKRTVYELSEGAHNESLPDELEAATLVLIAIGLSNEIEEKIIAGVETEDTGVIGGFDGAQTILLNSKEATKLKGSKLTKANVLGAVEKVYDFIPENVLQAEESEGVFCFCSYATRRKIRAALASVSNQTIASNFSVDDTDKRNPKIFYLGMEIVPVKGINSDCLIAYERGNFVFLTDLMSDLEDIELGNFPKPNEDKIFIKGRLRLGFMVMFEDEAVIMDPSISKDSIAGKKTLEVSDTHVILPAKAGDTKFKVTTDKDVVPTIKLAPGTLKGVSISESAEDVNEMKVTTVTVTAESWEGAEKTQTGQILVNISDDDRLITVQVSQRNEDNEKTTI